jgi:hypothetical protein
MVTARDRSSNQRTADIARAAGNKDFHWLQHQGSKLNVELRWDGLVQSVQIVKWDAGLNIRIQPTLNF